MKKHLLFFVSIFIWISTSAQELTLVPNQPDLNYYLANKVDDGFSFLTYYGDGANAYPGIYTFDGNNIDIVSFPNLEPFTQLSYLGGLNDNYYFKKDLAEGVLYEFDGSQTTEVLLPDVYNSIVYLANKNNKIYFAAQINGEAPVILSYNGNTIETFTMPGHLFGGEINRYFSDNQNLLYFRLVSDSGSYDLWSFDGQTFVEIVTPPNLFFSEILHEIGNELIVSYSEQTTGGNIYYLYKYDGTNLSPIISPPNTTIFGDIGVKPDKIYLSYKEISSDKLTLYEFDGNSLTSIETATDNISNGYIGEFNGKDYFYFIRLNGSQYGELYSYDGSTLSLITGPSSFIGLRFAGTRDNNLYIFYDDFIENKTTLMEYKSGSSEVTLVPNQPEGYEYYLLDLTYQDKLIYSFTSPEINNSFVFDGSGFSRIQDPEYEYCDYDFILGEKIYFNCFKTEPYEPKLFSWDGVLDITEVNQNITNSISVFPNPVIDNFDIQFKNTEDVSELKINLYSIDGKLLETKKYSDSSINDSMLYPASHLNSGMYILEITSNLGSVSKKIIKK